HERHDLRLEVGRKPGKRLRHDVDAGEAPVTAAYAQPVRGRRHLDAGGLENLRHRRDKVVGAVHELQVAVGDGGGYRISAGLDAVGQYRMPGAAERGHALDADLVGARALDPGAHGDEALGEIRDLRLARRVDEQGLAL